MTTTRDEDRWCHGTTIFGGSEEGVTVDIRQPLVVGLKYRGIRRIAKDLDFAGPACTTGQFIENRFISSFFNMKYVLITLSIVGLVLLALQFDFIFDRTRAKFVGIHDIKGFDAGLVASNGSNTARFDSLFNKIYVETKAKAETFDNDGFATHLIVIILTALSTLISTYGSIKGGATPKPIFLILVAAVTFLATVSGAVESRFTDKKNEAVNRQQKLLALEVSFGKDWPAAPEDKKDEVQETYIRNLLVI
jgi:hypothetical protein